MICSQPSLPEPAASPQATAHCRCQHGQRTSPRVPISRDPCLSVQLKALIVGCLALTWAGLHAAALSHMGCCPPDGCWVPAGQVLEGHLLHHMSRGSCLPAGQVLGRLSLMPCLPGCLQAKSLDGKLVETEKRLRDVVQASQVQAAKARLEVSSTTPHLHAAGCNRQMHAPTRSASSDSESL